MSIVVVGYQGRGSYGDDLMVYATSEWLRSVGQAVTTVSLPRFPGGVVAGLRDVLSARGADAVVLAGGTHFHTEFGTRSGRLMLSYGAFFGMLRCLRMPVLAAAVGLGRIARQYAELVRCGLGPFTEVSVRDRRSRALLKLLDRGRREALGEVVPDLAFLRKVGPPVPAQPGRLLVSLLPFGTLYRGTSRWDNMLGAVIVGCVQRSPWVTEVDGVLAYRGRPPHDGTVLESTLGGLGAGDFTVRLLNATPAGEDWIGAPRAAIAMRYHVALATLRVGIPTFLLAYEPKVLALARQAGVPRTAVVDLTRRLPGLQEVERCLDDFLGRPDALGPSRHLPSADEAAGALLAAHPALRSIIGDGS